MPARVTLLEPTGSEIQVIADLGGIDTTILLRDRQELQPGDEIRVLPSPAHVHLFSDESGIRHS